MRTAVGTRLEAVGGDVVHERYLVGGRSTTELPVVLSVTVMLSPSGMALGAVMVIT